MKREIAKGWKLLPSAIRKTIVSVIGSTLIVIGLLLSVLPGPWGETIEAYQEVLEMIERATDGLVEVLTS